MIERLIYNSIIAPGSSSFLKELCSIFYSVINKRSKLNTIYLSNLLLWINIIKKSIKGILIKKLILHMPTMILFTNASSSTIGRFNL